MNTYHYSPSQSYRSREHLVGEFSNKITADRTVLTKLLLELFRVLFEMLEDLIVGRHEYRCYFEHSLAKMYPAAALVRSSHEENAICRELDRSVFL